MSYSQALEEQIKLTRRFDSADGSKFLRLMSYQKSPEAPTLADLEKPTAFEVTVIAALTNGETYYWSPLICDTIRQVSRTMPPMPLIEEALPSHYGFFWFANELEPSPCDDSCGGSYFRGLRAVSWARFGSFKNVAGEEVRLHADGNYEGIAVTFYSHKDDDKGALLPTTTIPWRFGHDVSEAMALAYTENLHAHRRLDKARMFAACMSFLGQRILIAPQQQVERHTRKRLERDGFKHEPLVRVVELRRKQVRPEHHGESEPVEWSHQWIVSGHWRQQWYPSLNANQPIWVMPYVKGPEDKPLKPPRAKVFAVIR